MSTTTSRTIFVVLFLIVGLLLSGCGSTPIQRSAVEKLSHIEIIHVVTPALERPTFMQLGVQGGALGGAIPAAIAESQENVTISPPIIADIGDLFVQRLKRDLSARFSWWPATTVRKEAVPANYANADSPWLRVEIRNYHLVPGFGKLSVSVKVSLLNARNQGPPLWEKLASYSGIAHDGRALEIEKLPGDPSQVNKELDRAAAWLAAALVKDIR